MAVTSSERVPFNPGTNLSGPLAPKQIGFGITRDEMNKRQGQFHDSLQTATKKTATLMDPAVTPYIDNATAAAFKTVHDSAALQQIYSESFNFFVFLFNVRLICVTSENSKVIKPN